jgi:hypothetical protein
MENINDGCRIGSVILESSRSIDSMIATMSPELRGKVDALLVQREQEI